MTWTAAVVIAAALVAGRAYAERTVWPAWVIPETVNVRSGPGTERDKIGTLTRGTKVHVTAFRNKWCWAKLPSGQWGWIAEWLLQFSWDKGRRIAEQAAAPASGPSSTPPVWVKVGAANVRSGPGLGYQRYGSLPQGTKLYKLSQRGGWVKCKTPGGSGWIHEDLLEFNVARGRELAVTAAQSAPAASSTTAKAYINANNVRLRRGPGTNHEIVATLKKGQVLYVYGSQGDWKQVQVHGGGKGWVSGQLIKQEGAASPGQSASPVPPLIRPPDFPSPEVEPASEPNPDLYAWIGENRVNVRAGPGKDHPMQFQLTKGQKVQVLDVSDHWCKINSPGGQTGWVAGWVVDFAPSGERIVAEENGREVEVRVGWVARPEINLRNGPGLDYEEIGELVLSTQVIITGQKDNWYQVLLDNEKSGWVASWLIDTREQRIVRREGTGGGSPGGGRGALGSQIVQTAMRFLGNPYVRRGSKPGGFDCSGFVQYVLGRHNIRVGRTCSDQLRMGRPVSRSQLQAGDIVFFKNTYRRGVSHVGIYVNSGIFIHASHSGSTVKKGSLTSNYYASRYVGARRMH